MSPAAVPRRGRPLKFGRRTQLVTLTLPEDVVQWLGGVDSDLAWAVVKLHERVVRDSRKHEPKLADLAQLPGNRALILVKPEHFRNLRGVSVIQLADGRGFLALDAGKGVADLELSVIDRLDQSPPASERHALESMRQRLRQWRQDGIDFESRSIIVARRPSSRGRALSPIRVERADR